MKLSPPCVSFRSSLSTLAEAIETAKDGILLVQDLPQAPDLAELASAFDFLSQQAGTMHSSSYPERINQAYPKNLVYKDSFAAGHGGPTVDLKRVLDLSPERLEAIQQADPELYAVLTQSLAQNLDFWKTLQETVGVKILQAVAQATGSEDVLQDYAFNYRMVDYYQQRSHHSAAAAAAPPRCGEHRDFGTFTLIFRTSPGLQVRRPNDDNPQWMDVVPPTHPNSALLLFGWCTQIRSNARIPAALHRVTHDTSRFSSILFCAPKQADTALEPVVRDAEPRQYLGGICVGQLRGNMARKWRHREGTLSQEDWILEEEEIRVTNRKSQDDVVRDTVVAASS